MSITLLRLPQVLAKTGRCKASHYADINDELMVSPIRIGIRAAAYPDHEIDEINAARVRGASPKEIQELVHSLIAARTKSAA